MASGGQPPDTLNERHRLMVLLVALGWSNAEIGKALDYSPNRVSIIRQSPLFKSFVAREQERLAAEIRTRHLDAIELLQADTPDNIAFIRNLRLGKIDDDGVPRGIDPDTLDVARLRLDAAKTLLDRQVPKRSEGTTETTIRITLEDRRRFEEVDREFAIPVESLPDALAGMAAQDDEG